MHSRFCILFAKGSNVTLTKEHNNVGKQQLQLSSNQFRPCSGGHQRGPALTQNIKLERETVLVQPKGSIGGDLKWRYADGV